MRDRREAKRRDHEDARQGARGYPDDKDRHRAYDRHDDSSYRNKRQRLDRQDGDYDRGAKFSNDHHNEKSAERYNQ